MNTPSYLSDLGSFGAYGVDYDENYGPQQPAETPAPSKVDQLKQGVETTKGYVETGREIWNAGKELLGVETQPKTVAPTPAVSTNAYQSLAAKYQAQMSPQEFYSWSNSLAKYGPYPVSSSKTTRNAWLKNAVAEANAILRLRQSTPTNQQTTSGGGTDNKTDGEEKDNTMLYVGGAVAVLALAVGGYFLFKK